MYPKAKKVIATGLAVTVSHAALAATSSTTMGVSATVQNACLVDAADMAFGSYDPTSSVPTDATSSIDVTCTTGTNFTVGLNPGSTVGATVTTRQMESGASTLNYSLYSDPSRSTNWGNTPGTDTPPQTTAGSSATNFTVYGRVPAEQNVEAGSYADTVLITVTY